MKAPLILSALLPVFLLAACGSQEPVTSSEGNPASAMASAAGEAGDAETEPAKDGAATSLPTASTNNPESPNVSEPAPISPDANPAVRADGNHVITLGAGCFWCIEAVLEQVDGIVSVQSGYMGGHVDNPTYEQICTKTTGHAEVVEVVFDPKTLPLEHLLAWFWKLHDPTTLNRQGNDRGPQYRSAIFFHSDEQKAAAEASMKAAQTDFSDPIITEITPASKMWVAEGYHQDYYSQNKQQGYCRFVIAPKLDKLGLEK